MNRRWHRLPAVLAFVCLLALAGIPSTQAQAGARCFPETGYCIAGPIRDFWERNGGLMVFGFPITPQQPELIEGRSTQVQWFERSRLELHPENPPPYDVLLGRMGADRLGQLRRDWKTFPRVAPAGDCRAFAETGHAICGELLAAWQAGGLNLDGDPSINENESLALFGLPLSDATPERGSDGRIVYRAVVRARALRAAPREPAAIQCAAGPAWPRAFAQSRRAAGTDTGQRAHTAGDRCDWAGLSHGWGWHGQPAAS